MRTSKIKKYSKEQLQELANSCYSVAGMIRLIGYKQNHGGSYNIVKKYLQLHDIKTDHWTGQAWSKGEQLKDLSKYTNCFQLKKHLVKERGHLCEKCKLTKWLNEDIKLEVHHEDGDRMNNEYTNLKLLCPNCHSFTDSWKKKKQMS